MKTVFSIGPCDIMLVFCYEPRAGVTQLVECQLPKLNVASSNLVARFSKVSKPSLFGWVLFYTDPEIEAKSENHHENNCGCGL